MAVKGAIVPIPDRQSSSIELVKHSRHSRPLSILFVKA